jgi:hypothetical protein
LCLVPARIKKVAVSKMIARLLVLCAAAQILGGHWLALQSVAWLRMLATYAHGETLVAAIEKTFDGAHPCELCQLVKNGRSEEQKNDEVKLIAKFEAVLGPRVATPSPRADAFSYFSIRLDGAVRTLAPPTPPPQAV